ncbi:MAG: HTH-type transcriptional regulator CynR [Herbaspirillum frisingense]|uniref:HTH-type transcriptional regulator CynR n=1 Tax=Herbaspirillum frisingense TaxID=92645 RepID=A0A7V8FZ42_9BURK|nr:MAG: HTH-type transcriptional regulator CynR [Herbaspirillum frisingense]
MSTIRFLRTFVAAAHGGSFAAAAEQVALTQAAVGQQMRALEAELKTTLFDKTGRNMALTPAGHLLLPRARDLLEQYDAMRRDVKDQQPIAGTLKLGSLITGMGLLSTTLAELKYLHPSLEVELRVQDQSKLMDDILGGELDAALVVERKWPDRPGLLWTQCYVETLAVVAHSSVAGPHTSIASLFAAHPFIRFDRRTPTGAHIDRIMRGMQLAPQEFLELNSLLSIVELVRKNVGFTMVPLLKNFDWESDPGLCVLHVPGRPVARRLGILESGRRSHITGVVRDELLEQLRRMPAGGRVASAYAA